MNIIHIQNGKIQPFTTYSSVTGELDAESGFSTVESVLQLGGVPLSSGDTYMFTQSELEMIRLGVNMLPIRDLKDENDKHMLNKRVEIREYERQSQIKLTHQLYEDSPYKENIKYVSKKGNDFFAVQKGYKDAFLLLFPYMGLHVTDDNGRFFQVNNNDINAFLTEKLNEYQKHVQNTEIDNIPIFMEMVKCEGNSLILPSINDIKISQKDYKEIATKITKIGGVYNKNRFDFEFNPKRLWDMVLLGNNVNIFQEFQYFPTPIELILKMIDLCNLTSNMYICEPSAGRGHIAEKIKAITDNVDVCEFMPENREILTKNGFNIVADDFLKYMPENKYDCIIANPPFSKGQDIKHVKHMLKCVKNNGIVVSIISESSYQKNESFFQKQNAYISEKIDNAFTDENTGVSVRIVKLTNQQNTLL